MTAHLTPYEEKIIENLFHSCGTPTRQVAVACGHIAGGVSRASQSALVMQSLKRLEKRGLVKRLDGELPVAWVLANERGSA